jgi:hypothetical protein
VITTNFFGLNVREELPESFIGFFPILLIDAVSHFGRFDFASD